MDVQEMRHILAAAREYCMLDILSRTDAMSHKGMMRILDLDTDDYLGLSSVLDSENCIRSDGGFVSISDRGLSFADAIPLNTASVLPDWSMYGDFRSGIIIDSFPDTSVSEMQSMATAMGADGTEVFRIENGDVVRESVDGTTVLDRDTSRKLRLMTGLGHGNVLMSVHSSSQGRADIVSVAIGLKGLCSSRA